MFYGRTLLCFNGYQRLVKIAKLLVLFVCSILRSAEDEKYLSLTDPKKWRTSFSVISSNVFVFFLCSLILIWEISLFKRSCIVLQRTGTTSSSYQAFTASSQQISCLIWFRLYRRNFRFQEIIITTYQIVSPNHWRSRWILCRGLQVVVACV